MFRKMIPFAALAATLLFTGGARAQWDGQTDEAVDVCHFIAQGANEGRFSPPPGNDREGTRFLQNYFVHFGWLDLDGDGIAEHVTRAQVNGTSGGDAYDYSLSSDKGESDKIAPQRFPASIDTYLEENRFTYGEAFLPFKGRFYDVEFTDEGGAFPISASYYMRGGARRTACVFRNHVEIDGWVGVSPKEFEADEKTLPDETINKIIEHPLVAKERLQPAAMAARDAEELMGMRTSPACSDNENNCKDIWKVDFDNDGTVDRLVKVMSEINGGRGCEFTYFLLLAPHAMDGSIAKSPKQRLLMKLQNIDFSLGYAGAPCGMEFRWHRVAGRTILERRSATQPAYMTTDLVDDLWIARNGKTAQMKFASFNVTPKIIYNAAPK